MAEVLLVQQGATDEEMQEKYNEGYAAGNTAGYANGVAYGQSHLSGPIIDGYVCAIVCNAHNNAEWAEDTSNNQDSWFLRRCSGSVTTTKISITLQPGTYQFVVNQGYYTGGVGSGTYTLDSQRTYNWDFNGNWVHTCQLVIIWLGY